MAAASPLIALLTDFGTRDGFVAAMKGAALGVNPDARFLDISHEIAPQSVLEGALVLRSVFAYLPPGAIAVAVVDPGVGSVRAILAARVAGRVLLAPDNGLLAPILEENDAEAVHRVTARRYFREPVHPTFHGRDVFAPVAAHVSLGVPLDALGERAAAHEPLALPRVAPSHEGVAGEVIHIDRFGNLVTNLRETDLGETGARDARLSIGDRVIEGVSRTYSDAISALHAVVGSWGYVEIALRGGDAARTLGVSRGTKVELRLPRTG